jgi:holo-[acyl-carrier protein] synthase
VIFGVGNDIVEIRRVRKAIERQRFLEICFTPAEIELCRAKGDFAYKKFAGYFAAKEAVAKAMGTGFRGFLPRDIEILNDESGRPFAKVADKAAKRAGLPHNSRVLVSISHEREYAAAFAVIEVDCGGFYEPETTD